VSDHTLNNIMCLALIDGKFRDTLLTDAGTVLSDFDLDAEEQDILRAIKADSVTEYARKLHTWMAERRGGNGYHRAYEPSLLMNRLFLTSVD
jgi:hypothetical protein